ncbi:hypothetical protein B296_00021794 [Ensete ventricosum]|uniref:Uncharacterized protein n=1 Tax=Ensete ventricosum TaxID=4639 RepID=A0A426XJ91_ENSVE|nr:hypothetical protein B296_00021794 [Ensete ventricosum]
MSDEIASRRTVLCILTAFSQRRQRGKRMVDHGQVAAGAGSRSQLARKGQPLAASSQGAAARRGSISLTGDRLRAGCQQGAFVEVPLTRTVPTHRGGRLRAAAPAAGAATHGQGSHQQRVAPPQARRWRRPQDKDSRGGLGHPFEQRMVMPSKFEKF